MLLNTRCSRMQNMLNNACRNVLSDKRPPATMRLQYRSLRSSDMFLLVPRMTDVCVTGILVAARADVVLRTGKRGTFYPGRPFVQLHDMHHHPLRVYVSSHTWDFAFALGNTRSIEVSCFREDATAGYKRWG